MKISRKDTVMIAVLVNISLLAILFATASKWEKEEVVANLKTDENKAVVLEEAKPLTVYSQVTEKNPVDEIDQVLQQYALKQKVLQVAKEPEEKEEIEEAEIVVQTSDFFTVSVKKGEMLSKIAKAHGVSVDEIIKLNALENTKLRIGQSLKIPVVKKKQSTQIPDCISKMPKKMPSEPKNDMEYYVIKDGDNPWKVARRFRLKYEDLLRLNNLDEEKARNLKIGQQIRIR